MEFFVPIIVLTSIALFLGILLVLADKFLADYGDCKITIAGEEEFVVRGGDTLLMYLVAHKYNIPSACAGKASCGYCKVKVIEGGGEILPTERGFITPDDKKAGIRLACQVKVKNDMAISLPDFIETVRNIVKNKLYNPKLKWKFRLANQQYITEKKKKARKKTDTDHKEKMLEIIDRYRGVPGATIPVLQNISTVFNYLPEHALQFISQEMNIPYSNLYRITTFYNSFSLKPRGKNIIKVCMGTSCYVKGASDLLHALERELCIKVGENTPDLKFTLDTVNCIGCCGQSPVISVNEDIFGYMDQSKVIDIIQKYSLDEVKDEQVKA